jgi:hypothetical protein
MCQSAAIDLPEHATNKFEASSLALVRQGNLQCHDRHLLDTDQILD